jgi:hypothetical protein
MPISINADCHKTEKKITKVKPILINPALQINQIIIYTDNFVASNHAGNCISKKFIELKKKPKKTKKDVTEPKLGP